jgi:hypothetical protein
MSKGQVKWMKINGMQPVSNARIQHQNRLTIILDIYIGFAFEKRLL